MPAAVGLATGLPVAVLFAYHLKVVPAGVALVTKLFKFPVVVQFVIVVAESVGAVAPALQGVQAEGSENNVPAASLVDMVTVLAFTPDIVMEAWPLVFSVEVAEPVM